MDQYPYFNKSWFFGIHDYGWGNTTFFTYFSEFNRPSKALGYAESSFFILQFLFSLFGNVSVVYQIFRLKNTSTVTNIMISNLAIADILFTLSSPFIATARLTESWVLGNVICKGLVYSLFICAAVMIWTMAIISIDRYICITRPSSKKITPKLAIKIILILWIVWILLCIPVSMYFYTKQFLLGSKEVMVCTLSWPMAEKFRISVFFTVTVCVFAFTIPIIIMSIMYTQIIRKLLATSRAVLKNQRNVQGILRVKSSTTKSRNRKDVRIIKTLLLLLALFILMWLPIFIMFVVILMDGIHETMGVPSIAFIYTLAIALANACVNPFLYGAINIRLQRAVLKCLCCRYRLAPATQSQTNIRNIKTLSYNSQSDRSCSENNVEINP